MKWWDLHRDRAYAALSVPVVLAVRASVKAFGLGPTLAALERLARTVPVLPRVPPTRLFAIVDRAARASRVGGRCLTRSLVVMIVAKAQGHACTLYVGRRRDAIADRWHAWLDVDGARLDDEMNSAVTYDIVTRL
jgi:hypothetical protein